MTGSGPDPIALPPELDDAQIMADHPPPDDRQDGPRPAQTSVPIAASPASRTPATEPDAVDTYGADSFPASDAPSWWSGP